MAENTYRKRNYARNVEKLVLASLKRSTSDGAISNIIIWLYLHLFFWRFNRAVVDCSSTILFTRNADQFFASTFKMPKNVSDNHHFWWLYWTSDNLLFNPHANAMESNYFLIK